MSEIHVSTPDGKQAKYPEGEVWKMWEQGLIDPGALYWRQGMKEWQPLQDYLASGDNQPEAVSVTERSEERPAIQFAKNPHRLTSFVKLMFWMLLCVNIVSILSDLAQYILLGTEFSEAQGLANDNRQAMVGRLCLLVLLVASISFLRWTYRANANCRGFGVADMKFTAGWSVGWYFVPFYNLVRPYEAMKEIWQVSTDPMNWQSQKVAPLVGTWWGLWVLSGFLSQATFRTFQYANDVASLRFATLVSIAASSIEIFSCVATAYLVAAIYLRQKTLVESH